MNNKKRIFIPLAAALCVCACGGSSDQASAPADGQVAEQVAKVSVMPAAKSIVPVENVYSTTVQANIVNNIAPQSAGRIVKINVEIGDFVSKGQVLAEMDDAQLVQAALKLKNSEDELARVSRLLSEGGISQSDYDALELSYKVAKRSYDNLEENTILRSPVSGVVTARNYDCGDLYAMTQPLFTVQQITPVKMLVGISETEYTKVRKGDAVSITADALPGRTFRGRIVRVYPTMDSATHTFNAEVQVSNEDRLLRPGMYARATVNFGTNNSIVLPDQAVVKLQGAGIRSVFVVSKEGVAVQKVVTPGRHFGDKFEILDGLQEGELVVVKGQSTLKAGQKVEVEK